MSNAASSGRLLLFSFLTRRLRMRKESTGSDLDGLEQKTQLHSHESHFVVVLHGFHPSRVHFKCNIKPRQTSQSQPDKQQELPTWSESRRARAEPGPRSRGESRRGGGLAGGGRGGEEELVS